MFREIERLCIGGQFAAALERARERELKPEECFYLALVAFGQPDLDVASSLAERAQTLAPDDAVFAASAAHLRAMREGGKRAVYLQPDAFSAFIRAGSNRRLYRATSAALSMVYGGHERASILDIGVGDGMALLPALSAHVGHVIALEPSREMLEKTAAGLAARGVRFEAIPMPIEEYVERTLTLDCDVAQATFSLQNLPKSERMKIWSWLRPRARRVLVAEFDVPEFDQMYSARRVAYVLERYRRGLAEYVAEPSVVQGFLMPVMFGYFDPTAARTNYEQSRASWVAELQAGGFRSVRTELLDAYWWAGAYLFDAR